MNWIDELKGVLGDCVRTDSPTLQAHAGDKWHAAALPEAVVLATTTAQVAAAIKYVSLEMLLPRFFIN